jgi:hypothetical protein
MEDTPRRASGQLPILRKRVLGEFPYADWSLPRYVPTAPLFHSASVTRTWHHLQLLPTDRTSVTVC